MTIPVFNGVVENLETVKAKAVVTDPRAKLLEQGLVSTGKTIIGRRGGTITITLVTVGVATAEVQIMGGRHFLCENPQLSGLWRLSFWKRFYERFPYALVDQCAYGLQTPSGEWLLKSTTFG